MKEINSYGFNMADDIRKVRVEERLKIKIGEAKNLPIRSNGAPTHRDTYCVLSLDQEEIFRTSTIEKTLNPFFGEEFQFEVPRRFRFLSIYVFDRDKHLKSDKVLGKVAIKCEELHQYNNKDHWFALRPVDADSEVQGKAFIEVTLEDSRKRKRVEPKPPDPEPPAAPDYSSAKIRGNNLIRLSEYCKESMRFGSCSSSTSKRLLDGGEVEPALALSRSESLRDRAAWPASAAASDPGDCLPAPSASDYWSDPERHCAVLDGPDTLRLRVLECSELTTKNGHCDPFALVTLLYSNGRTVEKRTKPRKKTVNPQFDEMFSFDLVMEADPKDRDGSQTYGVACEARVSLWHDAATPIFLGEIRLLLRHPAPTPFRAWYFLTSRSGGSGVGGGGAASRGATPPGTRLSAAGGAALGSLRLLLQYTADHVFPLHHYAALERLLLDGVNAKPITASAVYLLGEIVSSKTDAAQPLVRLFTHHDLIVPIVRELADAEISALTDPTTIFRGNTLVSKMMDEAMRLTGAAYLRSVLRPTLAAVLAERRPCEIDPARVTPAAAVTPNIANLKDYVERVFAAITSSYSMCPMTMCRLFEALRQCAARRFPNNGEMRYSVVSVFIFLRFFAPAILGPRLFDLTTEQIDPATNRTLTLISKTIQSLGNLVSSRSEHQVCKEEYMAELYRSFCTPTHVEAIKQYLEIISTSSDTHNNNVQETPVLLKEGTMIKRSDGARASASPRRRWTRAAQHHAKRRLFRLTSGELSWSRCGRGARGSRSPARRLSLSGVQGVGAVDVAPPGAPLGHANVWQIVHRERTLLVQAGNCVERAEWVRLLTALCRTVPHKAYYADEHWTCCGKTSPSAEGCGGTAAPEGAGGGAGGAGAGAGLPLRLDPARDLERLHALLLTHAQHIDARLHNTTDVSNVCEREQQAVTLRRLQEVMYDLELRHRTYRRSLVRETKYGSKQAPIGDDNYLQVMGAGTSAGGAAGGRRRDLDGLVLGGGLASSSYLVMCRQHPPARPPRQVPHSEYVPVSPPRPPACSEYELMADFSSAARAAPPAVPPRRSPPAPTAPAPADSLDELRADAYCVLHVAEDEPRPEPPAPTAPVEDEDPPAGAFSRASLQRKSNPTKSRTHAVKPLKTSNSTSNVHDAGTSKNFTDRLPFFFKKKTKSTEDPPVPKPKKEKEDNLIGRLTPRFGQSRLYGRGRSLELGGEGAGAGGEGVVASLRLLSLHRFGAEDAPSAAAPAAAPAPPASDIRL